MAGLVALRGDPLCLSPPIPRAGCLLSWSYRALEGYRGPEAAPHLGVPLYSSSLSPAPLRQVQARHRPSSLSYGLILQPHKVFCPLPWFPWGYTDIDSPPCLGDRGTELPPWGEPGQKGTERLGLELPCLSSLKSSLIGRRGNCHPGFK